MIIRNPDQKDHRTHLSLSCIFCISRSVISLFHWGAITLTHTSRSPFWIKVFMSISQIAGTPACGVISLSSYVTFQHRGVKVLKQNQTVGSRPILLCKPTCSSTIFHCVNRYVWRKSEPEAAFWFKRLYVRTHLNEASKTTDAPSCLRVAWKDGQVLQGH